MFCSGCGTQLQSGLNYCSRCGRRVAGESAERNPSPTLIAGFTAGAGFFGFIIVLRILTKSDVPPGIFVPISLFYFAALFGICSMILRHSVWFTKSGRQRGELGSSIGSTDAYTAPAPTTSRLKELADPVPRSVVENTTRTLDEVRIDQR